MEITAFEIKICTIINNYEGNFPAFNYDFDAVSGHKQAEKSDKDNNCADLLLKPAN